MNEIVYLDTNIWLDLYYQRNDRVEIAEKLFMHIIEHEVLVIYSDLLLDELKHQYLSKTEISTLISQVPVLLKRKAHIYSFQNIEARNLLRLRKLPFADCLHAIIARDNQAVMITRDHDFQKLKDIVISKQPEEIIT